MARYKGIPVNGDLLTNSQFNRSFHGKPRSPSFAVIGKTEVVITYKYVHKGSKYRSTWKMYRDRFDELMK